MNQSEPEQSWAEKELEKMKREKAVKEFVMGLAAIVMILWLWNQQHQQKKKLEEWAKQNHGIFGRPAVTAPENPNDSEP